MLLGYEGEAEMAIEMEMMASTGRELQSDCHLRLPFVAAVGIDPSRLTNIH
ncbi:hypothetical protein DsansV1_C18g0150821 [Dioscorea sansibarensis]